MFDIERERENKRGVIGLVLLLVGGVILFGSLLLLWNFLCKCFKKSNVSV